MNQALMEILVTDLTLDPHQLRPQARLEDAGLDSLALVELGLLLHERSGVQIGEDVLSSATTLGALDQLVEELLAGR
ncbi:phosphopantetheine-binding protein [Streptomyces sp. NPDC001404]|uniref:phosphopantetheine-binding protein n=1 Tax=Streptomyces sp. NPDC001404 TaxID=3364571 RepID=UPI0036776138